jgi:hypothetical protein
LGARLGEAPHGGCSGEVAGLALELRVHADGLDVMFVQQGGRIALREPAVPVRPWRLVAGLPGGGDGIVDGPCAEAAELPGGVGQMVGLSDGGPGRNHEP